MVTRKTDWFDLREARLQLKSFSQPMMEMAVANARSPTGALQAGKHGIGMLSLGGTSDEALKAHATNWGVYEETARANGKTPDQYMLTSLKGYIDYQRSYPNADGELIRAKPLFYEDARILLFFNRRYVYHFFGNWPAYNGLPAITGSEMQIVIKDPSEDISMLNPPPPLVTNTQIPQAIVAWASAMEVGSRRPKLDSPIAFWKRPRASGASISSRTEMPPALSPPMVTLVGSPPKLAILAFTHFRAAIWSIRP